jgi:hypothetical protein
VNAPPRRNGRSRLVVENYGVVLGRHERCVQRGNTCASGAARVSIKSSRSPSMRRVVERRGRPTPSSNRSAPEGTAGREPTRIRDDGCEPPPPGFEPLPFASKPMDCAGVRRRNRETKRTPSRLPAGPERYGRLGRRARREGRSTSSDGRARGSQSRNARMGSICSAVSSIGACPESTSRDSASGRRSSISS